jgi:ATP-dependent Lhr-like helicase
MTSLPFHPAVTEWFRTTLGEPTTAQVEGWDAIAAGRHALIAAPTGSGKTLAAFLYAIDELFREGLDRELPDEVRVVYVSPLKALSTDIHKNLEEPLAGIRDTARAMHVSAPVITSAVRSGDTPSSARARMLRKPPHILVTTPESLYLLLTAERSREMLRTVRTVIVDEIHAVLDSRRGSHQALTIERLQHVTEHPLQRIGLSATQKPIENVAAYLGGRSGEPIIIDRGHQRHLDLALEIPGSPLEAVMAHEVWEEIYERLEALIREHTTTLVFVNTRRMAERVAARLSDRLGEDGVTAHHGSLSKDKRLDAEDRLRTGKLQALVATASLELGIDIGHVDLVCQLGSPHWISTFLQRVGRSGHTVRGTPKGRLFPLTRDELVECTAMLRSVARGDLDRIIILDKPIDVLAQQIVAESACEDWSEHDLYRLFQSAYPYRDLQYEEFQRVVQMVSTGFTTRRGRRGALVHYDGVNQRLRGRRAARLTSITAGGAIPDNADYRVVLDPEETFIGTINEDFAIESSAGDVFQLGNASWRILQVNSGTVRVSDAAGESPTLPFWLGEAPARSAELSAAVAELRADVAKRLDAEDDVAAWLAGELHVPPDAAAQLVTYLKDARHILGVLPTQDTLVLERFFDEAGGMQLILHAPFGSRVNRAWGLALRKKFCRQFNFELQAAATEEGLLLSLGPQHSFPLDDVFRYLHPNTVRTTLIQALLDSPVFPTRWRWNATIALAVLRNRGGKKVPPPLQRMEADDLMAAAFPDAAACLENIGGDREIPDHPLVHQTIEDCLEEAMDLTELTTILEGILGGKIECVARDTPEPSVLCHEILNSAPYSFLDPDGEIQERRARAVQTRRATEPSSANELGALDRDAISRVADEAWPEIRDADELHDTLMTAGYLTEVEGINARGESWKPLFERLVCDGRATRIAVAGGAKTIYWVATERLAELEVIWTDSAGPDTAHRADAIREALRGRVAILGPTTARTLAASMSVAVEDMDIGLAALEGEGVVLRGSFTPQSTEREWCDRRLLARIHRYTLNRLRAEIEPVSPADFMRFLFAWQRIDPEHRAAGVEGLAAVITQLDGYELAASAWEADVLAGRCEGYDPLMLDSLCLTGRVTWGRLSPPSRAGAGPNTTGPIRSTPVSLFLRENAGVWLGLTPERGAPDPHAGLLGTQVENALGELVARGIVTADSFAGLRALLIPSDRRKPLRLTRRSRGKSTTPFGVESAGRWTILRGQESPPDATPKDAYEELVDAQAWALLRRYGVVFRRLLARETNLAPWRHLTTVYRRLEARGDIRGGRFVSGMSGEQFALSEAVGKLRAVRRGEKTGQLFGISAADPLNLAGIITSGARVPALASNRIVYQDGVPLASRESDQLVTLTDYDADIAHDVERAAVRRVIPPALRQYLGRAG